MLILIIESSAEEGCLVLADKSQVIAFKMLQGGAELSKAIAQEVKNLLIYKRPDLIAVGIGPGSYTGIRVGVSLARALAYGWRIPCLGFCSLKAFGPPPILIDGKQGGIYTFLKDKPTLSNPEDLKHLPLIRTPHPEIIRKRVETEALFEICRPDPSYLAKTIWDQFSEEGALPFELDYCSSP